MARVTQMIGEVTHIKHYLLNYLLLYSIEIWDPK